MIAELLADPTTSPEILEILSVSIDRRYDWWIVRRTSAHPNTPKEVLVKLSTNEDWLVRCYVAEHSNTPKEVVKKLTKDSHKVVRLQAHESLTKDQR